MGIFHTNTRWRYLLSFDITTVKTRSPHSNIPEIQKFLDFKCADKCDSDVSFYITKY